MKLHGNCQVARTITKAIEGIISKAAASTTGRGGAGGRQGIASARDSIDITIFRLDQSEVEQALASAVSRGVSVSALIAATNSTGEENLRKLELRLLGSGVTVTRTADDLARYHAKLMIVDHRILYLMAFNLTHADIDPAAALV